MRNLNYSGQPRKCNNAATKWTKNLSNVCSGLLSKSFISWKVKGLINPTAWTHDVTTVIKAESGSRGRNFGKISTCINKNWNGIAKIHNNGTKVANSERIKLIKTFKNRTRD